MEKYQDLNTDRQRDRQIRRQRALHPKEVGVKIAGTEKRSEIREGERQRQTKTMKPRGKL